MNKKIVTIHQPDFFPWLGFFDRWQQSDLYVILDDVQFIRRGWHHRDKIKTPRGSEWITVPVIKKGNYHQLIKDVKINNSIPWQSKILNVVKENYQKAQNFNEIYCEMDNFLQKKYNFLIDLNVDILEYVASKMNIDTPYVFSSEYNITEKSTEKLKLLTLKNGGNKYLTGIGSKNYLEEQKFNDEGVEVVWQDFKHPEYPQLHGEFIPKLSCLDYLMTRKND